MDYLFYPDDLKFKYDESQNTSEQLSNDLETENSFDNRSGTNWAELSSNAYCTI